MIDTDTPLWSLNKVSGPEGVGSLWKPHRKGWVCGFKKKQKKIKKNLTNGWSFDIIVMLG